jgi:hypothetical protein
MLFTLKHLLVIIAVLFGGAITGIFIARSLGLQEDSGLFSILASLLYLGIFCSSIFKFLRLRPLILPRCPHCNKRHGNYHIPPEAWPTTILLCISCGHPTLLHLTQKVSTDSSIPGLYLRWPRFLGFWKPCSSEHLKTEQGAAANL